MRLLVSKAPDSRITARRHKFQRLCGLVLLATGISVLPNWAWGEEGDGCANWLAKLASMQGKVDSYLALRETWRDAYLDNPFCLGDKVRTWEKSRALLQLKNETFVRLDQNTTLGFNETRKDSPDWVEVARGLVYFISRVPYELNIRTPFVNATIKGTEFAVRVEEGQTRIDVFEGRVLAANAQGEVSVSKNQAAVALSGQAPQLKLEARPEDAVHWTLYYPSVTETPEDAKSPAAAQAIALLRKGDVAAALSGLQALPAAQRGAPILLLEANALLSVGRAQEASARLWQVLQADPGNADALAMASIIQLVQNHKDEALRLAQQAAEKNPSAPAAFRALSYAYQAHFDLPLALANAQKVLELQANDANAWARVAELELALNDRPASRQAAEQAARLQPDNPQVLAINGFALLNREQSREAAALFQKAIRLDSSAPLPRFGLGLAKINSGELDAGTEDISIAATLDPRNALIRSYLGKAYYEQKRNPFAATQYNLAKQFDPKDPTPYFYGAIQKQTENRPVEALEDLQHAIELNDNRAIYRSRLALDSDLAARSSAVGRIYNDLGFGQRGLLEGWRSVGADPSDYSAHRFLSDSYANLSGHQMARVSELLQSQLLQPINVTPVQAHLAESNLIAFYGLGPSTSSFNEFNPLFNRDRLALQLAGLVGTRGTGADEVTQSGVWRNISYSLGQFHFATDGYRPQNSQRQDLYNAFVQAAITPDLNVQMEARYRDYRYEDVAMRFNNLPSFSADYTNTQTNTLRLGAHYTPSVNSDLITSLIYQKQRIENSFLQSEQEGYIWEGQYQQRSEYLKTIFGLGYYDVNSRRAFTTDDPVARITHGNSYWYNYIKFPSSLTWTLGLSIDAVNDGTYGKFGDGTYNQFNPKFGMLWDITPQTTLRLAGFSVIKRSLLTEQTIEPTQVAGFNQFFDDYNSANMRRYGVGLDHRFSSTLFSGVEASKREIYSPIVSFSSTAQTREHLYKAYINWAPVSSLALSLSYEFSILGNFHYVNKNPYFQYSIAPHRTTHRLPFRANYFHPNGLFFGLGVNFVVQKLEDSVPPFQNLSGRSRFVLVDLGMGYRLPRRLGIIRLDIRNLFNENFQYQGVSDRTSTAIERDSFYYWPERTIMGQINLAF
jgi:Flp pilus assembly protein TadD